MYMMMGNVIYIKQGGSMKPTIKSNIKKVLVFIAETQAEVGVLKANLDDMRAASSAMVGNFEKIIEKCDLMIGQCDQFTKDHHLGGVE